MNLYFLMLKEITKIKKNKKGIKEDRKEFVANILKGHTTHIRVFCKKERHFTIKEDGPSILPVFKILHCCWFLIIDGDGCNFFNGCFA